jgi:hypothetical protein
VQRLILGPAVRQPDETDAAPAGAPEGTPRRRSPGGTARAPRHDRRDTLRSLAAELSAAAASMDEAPDSDVDLLRLPDGPRLSLALLPELDGDGVGEPSEDETSFADLRTAAMSSTATDDDAEPITAAIALTGHAEAAAPAWSAPAVEEPPAPSAQLERYRAEAEVLAARVEAEAAARAEAEHRLADVHDELVFLRNEMQMAGQKRRKPRGRIRRLFAALTGRRRREVPAITRR